MVNRKLQESFESSIMDKLSRMIAKKENGVEEFTKSEIEKLFDFVQRLMGNPIDYVERPKFFKRLIEDWA